MKRYIAALILIISLGAWSLPAQSPRSDLFDARKSQHELDIMRGIISTTLDFATRELQANEKKSTGTAGKLKVKKFGPLGHNVDAYYLYGQGATFIIPISGMRMGVFFEMEDLEAEVENLRHEAARMAYEAQHYAVAGVQAGSAPPPPPPPPAPPAAPAAPPAPPVAAVAPAPPAAPTPPTQADARQRLREAQEQVKRRRESSLEREKQLQEMLEYAKGYLIEAVANHGDSLTFLKPNEYINVVLTSETREIFGEAGGNTQIVSVQKSTIADYKAGRLTLDAFKQKVLQYTN